MEPLSGCRTYSFLKAYFGRRPTTYRFGRFYTDGSAIELFDVGPSCIRQAPSNASTAVAMILADLGVEGINVVPRGGARKWKLEHANAADP